MRTLPVALTLLALLFAGCSVPGGGGPDDFDGDATLALVEDFVYDHDGELRDRTPSGYADDSAGLNWIRTRTVFPGWTQSEDIFNGREYAELELGAVARYADEPYCNAEDREELETLDFRNVYATRASTNPNGGHVVLAAHWDAKEDAEDGDGPIPGANDGASGVAVLVQLQKHISDHDLTFPFDLTMAYFDGEDGFEDCHPLAGSLWSARQRSLGNISQLVLLDMVGDADARFIRESQSTFSDAALVDALWAHAATTDLADNFVDTRRTITDDHVPFIEEGIPAIDIIDAGRPNYFPPYWHTLEDTPDKLSADMLGDIGDLMLWMLTDPETQALLQD